MSCASTMSASTGRRPEIRARRLVDRRERARETDLAQDPSTIGRPTPSAVPRGSRVLIIDDDLDVADGTAEVLTDSGFAVRIASTTQDAVEMARDFDAQIALIDMNLGHGGDGLKLISALREFRPQIVTVVVTAYANKQAIRSVVRSGANGYLRKPFHPHELFQVLERSIAQLLAQDQDQHQDPPPSETNQAA
jgi:DNA-binding response OmpR family regulator